SLPGGGSLPPCYAGTGSNVAPRDTRQFTTTGARLPMDLFLDDRATCAAHDRRRGHPDHADHYDAEGQVHKELQLASRDQRPLLALRRHRLDIPLPAALPDGLPPHYQWTLISREEHSCRMATP